MSDAPTTEAELLAYHNAIESARALVIAADSDNELSERMYDHLIVIERLEMICAAALEQNTPGRDDDGFIARFAVDTRDREIGLLRAAVTRLGAECDLERGKPDGTFAREQFNAIDKALSR